MQKSFPKVMIHFANRRIIFKSENVIIKIGIFVVFWTIYSENWNNVFHKLGKLISELKVLFRTQYSVRSFAWLVSGSGFSTIASPWACHLQLPDFMLGSFACKVQSFASCDSVYEIDLLCSKNVKTHFLVINGMNVSKSFPLYCFTAIQGSTFRAQLCWRKKFYQPHQNTWVSKN